MPLVTMSAFGACCPGTGTLESYESIARMLCVLLGRREQSCTGRNAAVESWGLVYRAGGRVSSGLCVNGTLDNLGWTASWTKVL